MIGARGSELAASSPWRALVALLMLIPILIDVGWHERPWDLEREVTHAALGVLWIAYAGILGWQVHSMRRRDGKWRNLLRITRPEQIILVAGTALAWSMPALSIAATMLLVVALMRFYLRLVERDFPPSLVFLMSFVALLIVGTALLMLPAATPRDQPISPLDAAFTITSAISQTGLVVRDTGTGFTRLGQIVIMIWIQVGALGVLVFGALIASFIGSGFGLRATQTIAEGTEQGWTGQLSLQKLVSFIIIVTHGFELIGAVILYFAWPGAEEAWAGRPHDFDTNLDRAYHSMFFSVSAFCNAGFATTTDSMESLRAHWLPHTVIVPLIVLGSIGFPVLANIWDVFISRIRGIRVRDGSLIRLNLNTKVVLSTALVLYVLGFGLIFLGEVAQAHVDWKLALLDAHFMNINRTSGFDTIAPVEMGLLSRLSLIALMFVGGSPGSVAGGIKLMVFAVLVLTVWSTIRGREHTTVFGRTIPDALVRKCATLIVLSLVTVMSVAGVLAFTDANLGTQSLGPLLFEATSAFGTTGLSTGITSSLSFPGKIAIMVAMFVGRVGPLAVMAGLASVARARRARHYYPTEEVVVY
ncbi:MAG: hypothetical protein KDA16_01205 [Phycisphaerales bacterium]|nr:hypothetical protein [Phycisphaerales bacterium]